ncbi:hypothetical protein FJT64_008321 [Amphibalanus amphitrite]|uniref:Nose resistant-to-fluoxetine protein N-terminal domain-containing protein n=1 Tax=Amphibalanus amphitrite TaxID=1232801 RepID=A0A6A4VJV8_AMPAM|nr:hypothetical protein FJT64_008321 [Amphibalanus amphitrite]
MQVFGGRLVPGGVSRAGRATLLLHLPAAMLLLWAAWCLLLTSALARSPAPSLRSSIHLHDALELASSGARTALKILSPVSGRGSSCRRDSRVLLAGLLRRQSWALTMLDAQPSLPDGLLAGRWAAFGSPDQCTGVNVELGASGLSVQGQYCLAYVRWAALEGTARSARSLSALPQLYGVGSVPHMDAFQLGRCVPASCSPADVEHGLRDALGAEDVHVDARNCRTSAAVARELAGFATVVDAVVRTEGKSEGRATQAVLDAFSWLRLVPALGGRASALPAADALACLAFNRLTLELTLLSSLVTLPYTNVAELHGALAGPLRPLLAALSGYDALLAVGGLTAGYSLRRRLTAGRLRALLLVLLGRYTTARRGGSCRRTWWWGRAQERNGWWPVLALLSNYYSPLGHCLGHAWFLAVQAQLWLVSPLLVLLSVRLPRLGTALLGDRRFLRGNVPVLACGWTLAVGLPVARAVSVLPFAGPAAPPAPLWFTATFSALSGPCTALSVCWVVAACQLGHGGPLGRLVTMAGFRWLRRVSAAGYLLLVPALLARWLSVQHAQPWSLVLVLSAWLLTLLMVLPLAAVLTVVVAQPLTTVGTATDVAGGGGQRISSGIPGA